MATNNPFDPFKSLGHSISGGDLLGKSGDVPRKAHDEVLRVPQGGGGSRAKPSKPDEPSEPDLVDYAAQEPAVDKQDGPKEGDVKLKNLTWSKTTVGFGEEVHVMAEAELPGKLEHLTRIQFAVFARTPEGRKVKILDGEGHLKNGKAEAAVQLIHSDGKDDVSEISRTFFFTAKHKYSEVAEGPDVTAKPAGANSLELEIEDADEVKKLDYHFVLADMEGKVRIPVLIKDAVEKDGRLHLRFKGIDSRLKYRLDVENPDGTKVETIFQDKDYGSWQ